MATIVRARHELPLSSASLEAWKDVPSTTLSDVTAGACICDPEIRSLRPGLRLCGQALIVRCEPGDLGAVAHAIESVRPGDLIVIAANTTPNYAVIGDLFATAARTAGAVRDVGALRSGDNFSVCARHQVARASPGKSGGEINGSISFGGQLVRPGDLVLADDDGIAVVPLEQADALLPVALERIQFEARAARGHSEGRKAQFVL
jgi:4-hydroxy-4-methyl-2-oxoglutarate aldolase